MLTGSFNRKILELDSVNDNGTFLSGHCNFISIQVNGYSSCASGTTTTTFLIPCYNLENFIFTAIFTEYIAAWSLEVELFLVECSVVRIAVGFARSY